MKAQNNHKIAVADVVASNEVANAAGAAGVVLTLTPEQAAFASAAVLTKAFALIQPRVLTINPPKAGDFKAIEGTISGEKPSKAEIDALNAQVHLDKVRFYFQPAKVAGEPVRFRIAYMDSMTAREAVVAGDTVAQSAEASEASEASEAVVVASDAPASEAVPALLDPNAVLPVVIPMPEAGNALAIPESLFASLLGCTHAHHLPYQAAIVQYVDSVESLGFANKLVCDLLRIGVRRAFTEALNTISHQDLEGRVAQIHGLLRAMSAGYSRPAAYAAYLKSLEPAATRTPKLRLAGFAKYIAIADVIRTMLASPDVTDKQRAGYKFMLDNLSLTNKAQADAMYAKMEAHPGCSKVLAYALEVIAVERAKAAAEAAAAAQAATSDIDVNATMDELF